MAVEISCFLASYSMPKCLAARHFKFLVVQYGLADRVVSDVERADRFPNLPKVIRQFFDICIDQHIETPRYDARRP